MKKVTLLGRGKSLEHIDKLPECDLYVLANRFGEELKKEPIKSYLLDKNIYHVCSRVPGESDEMIRNKHYTKYNIQKVVQPYTVHMKNPLNFSDGNNRHFRMVDDQYCFIGEGKNIPAEMLGDHHIPHMDTYQKRYPHHYPSTGNAAFGYVTIDLDATDIYVVGMDFYHGTVNNITNNVSAEYFSGNIFGANDGISYNKSEDTDRMKDSVMRLISSHPNINFTFYTYADFNSNQKNCSIIKL